MVPGYEWVFIFCYVSAGIGGVMLVREAFLIASEYRARRSAHARSPRRPRLPGRSL
jgi:hypothetical protein